MRARGVGNPKCPTKLRVMLDRRMAHSRMTPATQRRIVALALTRTIQYGLRSIAAPGLVAAAPDEHATRPPNI